MVIFIVLIGVLVVNIASAIFYYKRTKRLFRKYSDQFDMTFGTLETRMVRGAPDFEYIVDSVAPEKKCWVVMCSYNRNPIAFHTLETLRVHEPHLPILVIDNGSSDGSREILTRMLEEKKIDKLLFNDHDQVPQWQKSFALTQAFKLLSLELPRYIVWIDDDVEVIKPFLKDAITVLHELESEKVKVISMTDNEIEESYHPTIRRMQIPLMAGMEEVKLRSTFNGQFDCISSDFLKELGYPPIGAGINNYAIEDWYYSRLLQARGYRAACFVAGIHLGNKSMREEKEREIQSRSYD